MKKILLIVLLICGIQGAYAQGTSKVYDLLSDLSSGQHLTDTVTNTGVVTMSSPIVAGAGQSTTVTAAFVKLTGTVAGTATLLGSINGSDWVSASATSYTVTDVANQATSWILTNKPFLYFRVSVIGSGTSTYTVKGQTLEVLRAQ